MARDIKYAAGDLQDFFEQAVKDEIVEVAAEIFNEVVQRTPLDTGDARKSWQITTNSIPTDVSTNNSIELSVNSKEDTVYITSNIDYMVALNAGHSDQAEANFIEHSVAVVDNKRSR